MTTRHHEISTVHTFAGPCQAGPAYHIERQLRTGFRMTPQDGAGSKRFTFYLICKRRLQDVLIKFS